MNIVTQVVISHNLLREAIASCALDGETQSFPEPNVMVFRKIDGKLVMSYEYHPDFKPRTFYSRIG